MTIVPIAEGIQLVSVNAEGFLFEGMWDLPYGVSINSYVVGKKEVALIDGICGWDGTREELDSFLVKTGIELENIKYVILNHMEPDHTEWLRAFIDIYQDFDIYCSKQAGELVEHFFGKADRIHPVKDGETLELADGHKLTFITAPGVHWPDTIMTFEETTKTLFSCDNFGSFGLLKRHIDQFCTDEEMKFIETQQQRYYADILATFSTAVGMSTKKAIAKDPAIIAPGHGLVWKNDVGRIIADYERYVAYAKGVAKEEVLVLCGSMYGMSEKMADHVAGILEREGMAHRVISVNTTDLGTILQHAWSATGIIVVASTYELHIFPPMAYALEEMGKKNIKNRIGFYTGSYGWSGGGNKEFNAILERNKMNWDLLEGYEFRGMPKEEDKKVVGDKTMEIIRKVREVTA
ncbi:MAG TPA: FprA family A-type flavoprotein [Tissierellia bacterium]|nr:FprA family A-type flavoprotein [Tissierellia bacterium]